MRWLPAILASLLIVGPALVILDEPMQPESVRSEPIAIAPDHPLHGALREALEGPLALDLSQGLPTGVLVASERNAGNTLRERSYAVIGENGLANGTKDWHTFRTGGNCCEHYLTVTDQGWIVNLGAAHPVVSKDAGASWTRASPANPMLGAEGAVAAVPGGDIIGMTWDPYTGDQVVSYRYDAATDNWYYTLTNLKTPFYDRPWISVAPGPFVVGDVKIPYVTFLRGGLVKTPQYMSLDGLHYVSIEHRQVALAANVIKLEDVTVTSVFPDFGVSLASDFAVPHQSASGAPLPRGGYLNSILNTATKEGQTERFAILGQDLRWLAYEAELPRGNIIVDEHENIHVLEAVGNAWLIHHFSDNGGLNFTEYRYQRLGAAIEEWEFKVNAELGIAALLIRWDLGPVDQDVLYKAWGFNESLAPDAEYLVGDGDADSSSGILSSGFRYDFNTLGILPDGRVVAGFHDRAHRPGFAVELDGAPPRGLA